jgi:tRNA(Ile2) C34 agmatinyltransferase TiaS
MSTMTTTKTPKRTRTAQPTTCPSCSHRGESAGTTVRCGNCGLVAPRKAFQDAATAARTFGQPRAYTIRGNID